MEKAIRLNGAAVEKNLGAFNWGRACVAAPDAVAALSAGGTIAAPTSTKVDEAAQAIIDSVATRDEELLRLLAIRVPELIAYQDRAYAQRYADFVREAHETEVARVPGSFALTQTVARGLYKFMAFKDEYEVARLHLDAVEIARREEAFGADVRYAFKLHPPALRALGMNRKLTLGRWFVPMFKLLRAMRRLRKTRLDPFRYAEVRRVERQLIGEYMDIVRGALAELTADNHAVAVQLAELPDVVRGYEDIKLANVAVYRERVAELQERLASGAPPEDDRPTPELPITSVR